MSTYIQQCTDFERSTAHVDGYIQYNLATPSRMAWPRCSCPANANNEDGITTFMDAEVPEFCSHIKQALDERCVWREDHGVKQESEQRRNYVCPACGNSTVNVSPEIAQ
jgi:hypothetical protein